MPAAKDITGNRYGRLVAVAWTGVSVKNHGRLWECLCDCGNSTEVAFQLAVDKRFCEVEKARERTEYSSLSRMEKGKVRK